jgi:hypothetical protein
MSASIPFPFGSSQTHLERSHPHIVDRLRMLWGFPEGQVYLSRLLVDNRGGRQGFSREVFAELAELHDKYPQEFRAAPRAAASAGIAWRRPGIAFDDSHDVGRRRASV